MTDQLIKQAGAARHANGSGHFDQRIRLKIEIGGQNKKIQEAIMKFITSNITFSFADAFMFLLSTEIRMKAIIAKFTLSAILVLSMIGLASAQGSGWPTTSIDVTEFSFTPSTIDTTNSSQTVTITVRVTDSERDFWSMDVTFRSPRMVRSSYIVGIQDRISGNSRDGIYKKAITFYQYAEAGTWDVDNIHILDGTPSYYRWRQFNTSDLIARGFATQLQVINNNEAIPPTISDFTFTPTDINTTNGAQIVTITLRARDEASGVSDIRVSFSNPEGCYYYDDDCVRADFPLSGADRISGDEHDGIYRRVVPVSLPRAIYGANVYAQDVVRNVTRINSAELAALGYPSHLRVFRTIFDIDGDGRADLLVFRPSERTWYLNRSLTGFSATQFGLSTDRLTPADFDGDGKTDIAVFRDGFWYWLNSSNGSFNAFEFGQAGDVPISADFTGDGHAELAVYRNGTWWTYNLANNQTQAIQFGISTDKPVAADYDGDGKVDKAVYRGNGEWHLNCSSQGYTTVNFGLSTDKPVPADYDGDGKTDVAVFRPSEGNWYVWGSVSNNLQVVNWGLANDALVPADYDGDGKVDFAVYRGGIWYIRQTSGAVNYDYFGLGSDTPVNQVQ